MQNNTETLPGIDVLNTGYGDFELSFDPNKPDEVQKAKETITDMLKRGYAIFVKQGKETFRVRKFDADKNVYIIGSTPAEEVPIAEARATAVGRSAGGSRDFSPSLPKLGRVKYWAAGLVRLANSSPRFAAGA